jgi:hypothetical protein
MKTVMVKLKNLKKAIINFFSIKDGYVTLPSNKPIHF